MDFYRIKEKSLKSGTLEIYPDFRVGRTTDLMVRGKSFYAIWDEEKSLWSTDEYDVQRLVDADLARYAEEVKQRFQGAVSIKYLSDFETQSWRQFKNYVGLLSDNSHQLDEKITFANTEVKKNDYVSRKLPYPLGAGDLAAYDEIVSTLYNPQERDKFEWIIGAIIAGDAQRIQKFGVFYGPAGAGKSTIINIIQWLFPGYYITFEADALTSGTNAFSMEAFKSNPLIAIQHDGDLSHIRDNTKLNSIVSHEEMTMNEKYKAAYMMRLNSFLIMGTNKPVKITDAKSGLIRRLIDIQPTGEKLPVRKYQALIAQVKFELGAIAQHCLDRYRELGIDYYADYKPLEMMLQTDPFFNFIEYYYDMFRDQDGITHTHAFALYKQYCEETGVQYPVNGFQFREELKNYFRNFEDRAVVKGERVRSWYSGFDTSRFLSNTHVEKPMALVLDKELSLLDAMLENQPAQYANTEDTPRKRWAEVTTTLKDINTSRVHYVKPPLNHIVIDFDLKSDDGKKSAELNLEAASKWPATYAEFSKGGSGIHLHYIYEGDPTELSRVFGEGIEIKVFTGDSSLRRRVSACNDIPVATINSGLPLREKKMLGSETIKSERGLRDLIFRNLAKEIHNATKPSVDFIHKILEDAYESGMSYDVSDLQPRILAFANGSSNQALACIKLVKDMKFASEHSKFTEWPTSGNTDERLVFFDCEVFPNLFVLNWKFEGDTNVVRMINPDPMDVERLTHFKLVGFNCRRYDNHILYGRIMGYDNEQLYRLSQKLITGNPHAYFGEAYNLSYVDIYDYSSKKQSLKKFQIELGLHHQELGLPWDQPVPQELWEKVAEYCDNDVITTEQTHLARIQDFNARLILAQLSGLPVNATTQKHTAKIIFGDDREAQSKFVYTDLSTGKRTDGTEDIIHFPGYTFDFGKSSYRDEDPSEGGYVYAEPGMYENVAVIDVASMHPNSIINLNLFGPYTQNFKALIDARIAIKRRDFDTAKSLFDGALAPYLGTDEDAEALSYALKIVINIVYGLTSASFDNPFRDKRNKDNIVAKRGALFMIDLKNYVQDLGYQVVHVKTDSIKIPNADKKVIDLVMEFGEQYGYEFEHESTYERFCLVNDAVYIAHVAPGRKPAHWEAVGAQFQHPYVFKTLFTHDKIEFSDVCETKTVTTALYLDFTTQEETPMALLEDSEVSPVKKFVGKAGSFVPVISGGGDLLREKEGKFSFASGAKGHKWQEAEVLSAQIDLQKVDQDTIIDWSYFHKLTDNAVANISKYGDFEWFVNGDK